MLAPLWLLYVLVQGIMGMWQSSYHLFYFGVVLSAVPLLLFLSFIMLFRNVARTSMHLFVVAVPSLLGYVISLVLFLKIANFYTIDGMIYSMSSFLITLLYIYWYSANGRKKIPALEKGKKLPEFVIFDENGAEISSQSFATRSLLFFHRGNWCPLCMAQIKETVKAYQKFAQLNVSLLFIAPQSEQNTKNLAKKYALDFVFFLDKDNVAAKKLGIEHKYGLPMGFQALGYESDTVFPTVIAIDEKRTILYSNQTSNYRLRPTTAELLAIFS